MIDLLRNLNSGINEVDQLTKAAGELLYALKKADDLAENILPEDIAGIVKLHAKLSTGAAFIPIPGVDVLASAASIWSMYGRINSVLGISVKENILKTIASGVITNLASTGIVLGIGSAIKIIPGIGTVAGTVIMLAGIYASILLSGWVYIKVLTIIANKNDGVIRLGEIGKELNLFMKNNKSEIKTFLKEAKNYYKNNKESFKLSEKDKEKLAENIRKFKNI
ncbi:DUF697 domain-containing protein [Riemerella anatipestifer]|uniref:DUF697 domain-containing protein n=1 Tax=Riemerella anatipestifer TaxID=34085 RepID=UPI001BDAB400|nr:DUF697 domain-containing protein [Riemerella anatipestifer]MBT0552316.1 DUF697 domain-containing protein [Riemerella anatipestifer]MBT0554550.1 DUF697 domain-containing protein [Riemerella anatipestifer]MCE3025024.1 DUF697 domain-containing protein [Riemerella anatipestifer]MCT6765704.1 DUF697 domain-containing protein [Riemerella anatipestifer]MCT6769883.1 DUF697 domain-containing protein [Riemerella anatipestifer]